MDIADVVTTDFVERDVKTTASKLRGAFEEADVDAVVVTNGGAFEGLVTRKQLLASHHPPNETAMNLATSPPTVARTEDVREVARLMVENELKLLPVFEGDRFDGVVSAEDLLRAVRENLDVLSVSDVYTRDPVTVTPETSVGEVIHTLREHRFTRVPVIDDRTPAGLISVYDLIDFTVRQMDRQQGGSAEGFDAHGGAGSREGYRRTTGGYGDRSGFAARMLDLPARDVMTPKVLTAAPDESLAEAVGRMLDNGVSSLVVVTDDGYATGIVTETDALRSLTWTQEERIPVQLRNVDLLVTLTREEIAERIEAIDEKHDDLTVQEANVAFHEHEERLRGLPLVLTTVRLFTDRGRFAGSAEAYGAEQSFREASEVLEENVLEEKGRELNTHTRKDTPEKREEIERLLGWWVEAV
ncbi:CBS domain-containing protein [Halomarina halobia]|uniref:CBS domain-containing protein n=1 Tax=Halomarina halobia TaxID=3033386 RepID=A0ABD6A7U7_9EURY|nr:CBS domain-containing protein [Halomarina sp. PSR21]